MSPGLYTGITRRVVLKPLLWHPRTGAQKLQSRSWNIISFQISPDGCVTQANLKDLFRIWEIFKKQWGPFVYRQWYATWLIQGWILLLFWVTCFFKSPMPLVIFVLLWRSYPLGGQMPSSSRQPFLSYVPSGLRFRHNSVVFVLDLWRVNPHFKKWALQKAEECSTCLKSARPSPITIDR